MDFERTYTGAKWEDIVGYSRALRAGDLIFVTGTAPVEVRLVGVIESTDEHFGDDLQVAFVRLAVLALRPAHPTAEQQIQD